MYKLYKYLLFLVIILISSCKPHLKKNSSIKKDDTSAYLEEQIYIPKAEAKLLYLAGLEYARRNDYKNELLSLIKADSICSDNKFILTNLGTCYAIEGNNELAIQYFDKVIKLDSTYSKVYVNYSKELNRLKRYNDAIQISKKGLCIDTLPELSKKMLLLNLSLSFYGLKEYELALKELGEAKSCKVSEYKKDFILDFENQLRTLINNK